MSKLELARRENAAKEAIRIVRKFPQIEQDVIAPAITREIGMAILRTQDALIASQADRISGLLKFFDQIADFAGTEIDTSLHNDLWMIPLEDCVNGLVSKIASQAAEIAELKSDLRETEEAYMVQRGWAEERAVLIQSMRQALKNVFMVANMELSRRQPRTPEEMKVRWAHVHRFCMDAGCESSILRDAALAQVSASPPDTTAVMHGSYGCLTDDCAKWDSNECRPGMSCLIGRTLGASPQAQEPQR